MSLTNVGWLIYPSQYGAMTSGRNTLDAAEELLSMVIAIPKTGTLKKIGWSIYATSTPNLTVRVSVETVAETIGQPVAAADADKALYVANAVSADLTSFAAGVRFDAINGSTGISVTKGDLVSVTIRCIACTSGSISVYGDQYQPNAPMMAFRTTTRGPGVLMTRLGGTWTVQATPILTLEYDGEFVPCPFAIPAMPASATISLTNVSNPDRYGMKFRIPYGCKVKGCILYADIDGDSDLILYDSDEYTVMSGFPITIKGNQRPVNTAGMHYVEFPVEPTLVADTDYRLVVRSQTATTVTLFQMIPESDSAISGMTAFQEGSDVVCTSFNGTPDSGSHAWTDITDRKAGIGLVISEIDFPSGGGGLLTHPGMSGGMRG